MTSITNSLKSNYNWNRKLMKSSNVEDNAKKKNCKSHRLAMTWLDSVTSNWAKRKNRQTTNCSQLWACLKNAKKPSSL